MYMLGQYFKVNTNIIQLTNLTQSQRAHILIEPKYERSKGSKGFENLSLDQSEKQNGTEYPTEVQKAKKKHTFSKFQLNQSSQPFQKVKMISEVESVRKSV